MSKRQILGVVALLSAMSIPLNYNIFINHEQAVAGNVFSEEEYNKALERAEEAKHLAETSGESELYPGLADYMDRLINDAGQYGKYENSDEVTAALNEAADAIPYLLGTNRQQSTVATSNTRSSRSAEVVTMQAEPTAVTAVEEQVAQTEIKVEVKNVPEVQSSSVVASGNVAKAEVKTTTVAKVESDVVAESENEDEAQTAMMEEAPEEVAELPKTGAVEEPKMSYAGLIIAGVAVIICTIAASFAVVAAKRKM